LKKNAPSIGSAFRMARKKSIKGTSSVSIRDVAETAGVSLSSVSRVLNYVSGGLRERVHEAIRQLNFYPNAFARGLRASQSKTIGLILRDVANTTFATLWKAAVDSASEYGYNVLVISSENSRSKEDACIQLMLQQQVAGLAAFAADESNHAYEHLAKRIPLVLVESEVNRLSVDRVVCGNYQGAYLAGQFLIERNHRRVVLLSGSQSRFPGRERRRGFEAAFEAAGLPVEPDLLFLESHLDTAGRARLISTLLHKDRPTAIFAASSHLTLEALRIMRELELAIPDDISFVGFDNLDLAVLSSPSLTTVERDVYQLGARAIELLIARIRNPEAMCRTVTIPTELVIRDSVGIRERALSTQVL
jgi:LacI family transcriptional regulator